MTPFTYGSKKYTDIMKTQALLAALDQHGFDAAFGGARRDEEKSRAKERVYSVRDGGHRWDPKNQRPELWRLYNGNINRGEEVRIFPLSNWTELDVWQYVYLEGIEIVPLYFAALRPVVERDGTLIMVDDERMELGSGEKPQMRSVRFRTLGCYPPLRRHRVRRQHPAGGDPGDAHRPPFRAAGAPDRLRRHRVHGAEEARGVFLMAGVAPNQRVERQARSLPACETGAGP